MHGNSHNGGMLCDLRGTKMRKLYEHTTITYCVFLLSLSGIFALFLSRSYSFNVSNAAIWFVLNILLEGALAYLCVLRQTDSIDTYGNAAQSLPLLSLVYICVTGFLVEGVNVLLLTLHALFCFISCYIISLLYKVERSIRITSAILNTVLLCLLLAAIAPLLTFGQLINNTIYKQIDSPNGAYTAVLTDSNQGALGGTTFVDVEHNSSGINIGIGRFIKSERVYIGRWGEFETMDIGWQGERTLLINSKSYDID